MHPDRGIVHTNRRSYGISTRPYIPNTLTCQSAAMDNIPRNPPPPLRYMLQKKDNGFDKLALFLLRWELIIE